MTLDSWGGRVTINEMGATIELDGDRVTLDEYQTVVHGYEDDEYNPTPAGLCRRLNERFAAGAEVVERE